MKLEEIIKKHLTSGLYCDISLSQMVENACREHSEEIQLFTLDQFINGGLQVRRANEKNTLVWWYADGSNAEGDCLAGLLEEISKRFVRQ